MTYEAWRISYQSSEHAARAAYAKCVQLHVRLESAEKERDWNAERLEKAIEECTALRAALQHEADCVEAVKSEIEALRAKIAAMEQQKPPRLVTPTAYRWRYLGAVKWQYGELTEETARVAKEHNHEVQPLYLAPGAKGE